MAMPIVQKPTGWRSSFYMNLNPMMMQAEAVRFAVAAGRTFINLARPGTYGSTGNHMQRRREREVALINGALDQSKAQFGWTSMTLAGFSGGGHLVALLIARRLSRRLVNKPCYTRYFCY
jgi:hypothetical protein